MDYSEMNLSSWSSYLTRLEDLLRRDGAAPRAAPNASVEAARRDNAVKLTQLTDALGELVFDGYAEWYTDQDEWVLRCLGQVLTAEEEHQILSRLDQGTPEALGELITYLADERLPAWRAAAIAEFAEPLGGDGAPEVLTGAANTSNWQASRTPGTYYYTYYLGRYLFCDRAAAPPDQWLPLPDRDRLAAEGAAAWGDSGWVSTRAGDRALYGGEYVFAATADGPWLTESQAREQIAAAERLFADGPAGDWGDFGEVKEVKRIPSAPSPYSCPLCMTEITWGEFDAREVMRCPGEQLTGADHSAGVFVHVVCQGARPRCTLCGAVLTAACIVTTDDPPEGEFAENWGEEQVVTGWRGTTTHQSGSATCYAAALAAAMDGMGRATPNDHAVVHGWAMNDPNQDDERLVAYRARVAADELAHAGQSFGQRFARISAWPEWTAIITHCWGDLEVAAQTVPGLTLTQQQVRTGDEIVAILRSNRVCIAGDPSHFRVVYGYIQEATTGAVQVLCWDPKYGGARTRITIPGALEVAFAVNLG